MNAADFLALAEREEATILRMKSICRIKGISPDFNGTWFAAELEAMRQRAQIYRMCAEAMPAERQTRAKAEIVAPYGSRADGSPKELGDLE